MSRLIFILVILIAGCCPDALPSDVLKFDENREICDHLRGEVSGEPDQEGHEELVEKVNDSCEGTDKELSKMRMKYIKNQAVIDFLGKYPASINAY